MKLQEVILVLDDERRVVIHEANVMHINVSLAFGTVVIDMQLAAPTHVWTQAGMGEPDPGQLRPGRPQLGDGRD